MELGEIVNGILCDVKSTLVATSAQSDHEDVCVNTKTPDFLSKKREDYWGFVVGTKNHQEILSYVREMIESPHKFHEALLGQKPKIEFSPDQQLIQALNEAKPEIEILFAQHGVFTK